MSFADMFKKTMWAVVYYINKLIKYIKDLLSSDEISDIGGNYDYQNRRYNYRGRTYRGRGSRSRAYHRGNGNGSRDSKTNDKELNDLLKKIKNMEYDNKEKDPIESKKDLNEIQTIDKSNLPFVRNNTLYMGMEKSKGYRNKEVYIDIPVNITLNVVKTQEALGIVTTFMQGDYSIMITARHVAYAIQDKSLKVKINGLLVCTHETKDANIESLKLDIPYYLITKTDEKRNVLLTVKKVNSYPSETEEPEIIVCTLGFLDVNIIKSGSPIISSKGIFIISSQFYDENEVCYVVAANIKKHFNYTAVTNVFF